MSGYCWNKREHERDGENDAFYGRRPDRDRDPWASFGSCDRAYLDGYEDERRRMERAEEEQREAERAARRAKEEREAAEEEAYREAVEAEERQQEEEAAREEYDPVTGEHRG